MEKKRREFINPFCDFGFKRIFGQQSDTRILEDFLNALFDGQRLVNGLVYLANERQGNTSRNRIRVFDIHCKDESGVVYIIELQRVKQAYLIERSLYYSAVGFTEQGEKGIWNYKLLPVYTICILGFKLNETNRCAVSRVALVHTGNGALWSDLISLYYVEIPKFEKKEQELKSRLDQWLFVLGNMENLSSIPVTLKDDAIFREVFRIAEFSNLNETEMNAFIASQKEIWDDYSIREYATKEGREEGMKEGIKEGMKEGIKEGEIKAKKEVAAALKAECFPIEKIAVITGLDLSVIESL